MKLEIMKIWVVFVLLFNLESYAQKPVLPENKHRFVVIAHRGDHVNAPENTLTAFEHAIEQDVDYVEIDLRTSRDSQLVIMHDASTDRMTGIKGSVKDFTFDSLRQMKVSDKQHPEWKAEQIPSFNEVLQLCRHKIHIYLDFKEASVQKAYAEILKAGMEHEIVVYINAPQQYIDWRKIAPDMPLMISLPHAIKSATEMTQFLNSFHISILDGNYDEYNQETLQAAKEQGIPVWADIQSATEHLNWEKAIETGLKGLQTDHPADLIQFLKIKGIR